MIANFAYGPRISFVICKEEKHMNNIILSIRKKLSAYYSTRTKQTYNFGKPSISINFHDQENISSLLAKSFEKSQEIILTCTQIEVSLLEKSKVSKELLTQLEQQLRDFDRIDSPIVEKIKKATPAEINNEEIRLKLIDLGYIDRALVSARNTFNKIKNSHTVIAANRSLELQYA